METTKELCQRAKLVGDHPSGSQQVRERGRWLLKVPMLPHGSPHRAAYLRQWRVVEKIARAKQEGRLDALLGGPCAHCGQGLP